MRRVAALVLFAVLTGAARAESLAERAENGDLFAQFNLAMAYDLGQGMPQDAGQAFKWFHQAAEAGLPDAEFNVAVMLDSGRGVARNLSGAAVWYARAAARGHHRAQFNLALLYDAGSGVPRNPELAAFWFRQAAAEIPVAGRRLAALRPEARPGTLTAAMPAAPLHEVAAGLAPVEFVWTAPAQPEPVHYMIEIRTLDALGSREVYSEFTDGSAVLAPLREIPGEYAWRVFTLAQETGRYELSEWAHFVVSPESPTPQATPSSFRTGLTDP